MRSGRLQSTASNFFFPRAQRSPSLVHMKRWILCVGLVSLGLRSLGEAAPHPHETPSPAAVVSPWRVEHQGVTVEVQLIDAEQTTDIFSVDLLRKGVQPLLVKIRNDSAQTYQFKKFQVDAQYIPAAEAAKQAYDNPVAVGGRVVGRTLLSIPRGIFKSRGTPQERPLLNAEVQASFVREEIPDRDIPVNSALAGLMDIKPLASGAHLTLTLIDVATSAPLIFEITPPEQ